MVSRCQLCDAPDWDYKFRFNDGSQFVPDGTGWNYICEACWNDEAKWDLGFNRGSQKDHIVAYERTQRDVEMAVAVQRWRNYLEDL